MLQWERLEAMSVVGLTITFCTVLKSSVTSNWCFLEVSKCQALCYMLFKSNWINNHARLMRKSLFSHFTASERRLLLVNHLLTIIPPENHRAPIQPQGILVLEFEFQPLCYTASLNHVPTLCKHQNPSSKEKYK